MHHPGTHAAVIAGGAGQRSRGSRIGIIGTREAERAAGRTPREGQNDVLPALGVGHVDEFERERARLSPLYRRALTGLRAGRKQHTGPRLPL